MSRKRKDGRSFSSFLKDKEFWSHPDMPPAAHGIVSSTFSFLVMLQISSSPVIELANKFVEMYQAGLEAGIKRKVTP